MRVDDITDLVRAATGWIHSGPTDLSSVHGTGFFVAPGIVVTCAHVLAEAGPNPHLRWRGAGGSEFHLKVMDFVMVPADTATARAGMTFPDLALLQVPQTEHPIVPVGDPVTGAEVWCYGTTRQRMGPRHRPEPTAHFLTVQDAGDGGFIQLAGGSLKPGMSGGPVVDCRRKCVVGVIQSSLSDISAAGGYAVPVAAALDLAGPGDSGAFQGLRATVEALDRESLAALKRDQAHHGTLPLEVAARLPPDALDDLQLQLVKAGVSDASAPSRGTQERPEWLARQLLRIGLGQLVKVLTQASGTLGPRASEVFELVATLLPTTAGADSQWVPAECTQLVREEFEQPRPPIVQIATEEVVSTRLLLRRALDCWVALKCVSGASAATSVANVPTDLLDEIRAVIKDVLAIGRDDWEWLDNPTFFAGLMEDKVIAIGTGAVLDTTVMSGLADKFPGIRIVLPRRGYTPPPGSESLLHVVTPQLDPTAETTALFLLAAFNDALAGRGLPKIK